MTKSFGFYQDAKKRRRGRVFFNVSSGIQRHLNKYGRMSWINLTSSNISDVKQLNNHFIVLRKSIMRTFGLKEFIFYRFRSFEGKNKGVLHILAVVPFIPQDWLSKEWNRIHKASVVYISKVYSSGLAGYIIGRYLLHHSVFRESHSADWLFKDARKTFMRLLSEYGFKKAVILWNSDVLNWDKDFGKKERLRRGLDYAFSK